MKLAIIGAGPSGLGVLKEGLNQNFNCTVFEQSDRIGGMWNYSEHVDKPKNGLPISAIYDGLITNIPKETMAFEDFPHKQPDHSHISHREVLKYIQEFATHFNILQHVKLNTQITFIEPIDKNKWLVRSRNLKTGEIKETIFEAVVICNGHLFEPYIPTIPGIHNFQGRVIHCHVYRTPDSYKNKNVLVIGAGPSGVDISRILAPIAKRTIVCYKGKSQCCVGSTVEQKSTTVKCFTKFTAIFEDGSEEAVDDVIFCTGYTTVFPFLSSSCGITVEDNWVKPLYKHIININHPTMAIINLTDFTLTFPLSGMQAKFFFAYLKNILVKTKEEMFNEFDEEMKILRDKGIPLRYIHLLGPVEMEKYCADLATTAGIKNKQIAANKIFIKCFFEGFKMHNYKIVNEEEFEICKRN